LPRLFSFLAASASLRLALEIAVAGGFYSLNVTIVVEAMADAQAEPGLPQDAVGRIEIDGVVGFGHGTSCRQRQDMPLAFRFTRF
jgi:hypothetical protein